MKGRETESRLSAGQAFCCVALVLLLGVSGYAGARNRDALSMVSAPVVYTTLDVQEGAQQTEKKLQSKREQALALLESVLENPAAEEESRQEALRQKTQMAQSMQREAQIEEALERMGVTQARAICTEQTVAVFVSPDDALDEKTRMQIADLACAFGECGMENVKIILTKNE